MSLEKFGQVRRIGLVKFFVLVAGSRAIALPILGIFAENRKVSLTNDERARAATGVGGPVRGALPAEKPMSPTRGAG